MYRLIATALTATALLASGTGFAASIIEVRGTDQGQPIANDIEVNGDWVRITIREEGATTDIQFDSANDVAYIIDHQERAVTTLTEEGIAEVGNQLQSMMSQVQAQMQKSMAGMSEQQKQQFGGLLGNLGLGGSAPAEAPAPPTTRFTSDGTIREVHGIRCTEGMMTLDNVPQSQVCLADQADVPLSDAEFAVLRKLVGFGGRIADKISTIFPAVGVAMPSFDIDTISGLPVEIRDGTMQVAVTAIRTEDRPAVTLPEGYTRRDSLIPGQ